MSACAVTITGADDNVSPEAMARLSAEFPAALEWGVLCSRSRMGTSRYPSIPWVRSVRWLMKLKGISLSAHLCGSYARVVMGLEAGTIPIELASGFSRTQVNGYEPGRAAALPIVRRYGFEYILQARGEAMVGACAADARARTDVPCSVLFDPSGGRGARATEWPAAPAGVCMGYAGGISPANVATVLGEIREANGGRWPAWIDMESGVRDAGDQLDLAAVRQVLEAVARVCAEGAA